MNDANSFFVIVCLLYNLVGTVFIGMALFFRGFRGLLPAYGEHAVNNSQSLMPRIRQNLDGSMGIILLATGFALQAMGQAGQGASSDINLLLAGLLFLLTLLHFLYTRDVFAEQYARRQLSEFKQTEKNKAYFGSA